MKTGGATIIAHGHDGVRVCAAAARISTTEGDALSAYSRGDGAAKDIKLVGKVLSSGHNTIVEHQSFTIAFHNVSVLAEQLVIEHRLAAYTVKSRRYVDFSGAGYIIPSNLTQAQETAFRAAMDARFAAYERLLALGIPREDARFVLPYCFKSNFFMTVNAREFSHLLSSMLTGRMSRYPEMRALGESLKAQADELFPGVTAMEKRPFPYHAPADPEKIADVREVKGSVALCASPADSKAMLSQAMAFSDRCEALADLVRDVRPRELEALNYAFSFAGVSLACLTHFTRHRIQSLMAPAPEQALADNGYIVPDTVRANPEALAIYEAAFRENTAAAREMLAGGMDWATLSYYALAGHTVPMLLSMNARELLHFLKLRTCTRAQWEIRALANEMLCELMQDFPELFRYYGPSCAVTGFCPEGRLSCGRIQKRE